MAGLLIQDPISRFAAVVDECDHPNGIRISR